MGKVFITDEGNDTYSANVTSGGALQVNNDGYSSVAIQTAATSTSTWAVSSPCYLHSILITSFPATSTTLVLVNASASGESTATGSTGRIANIYIPINSSGVSAMGGFMNSVNLDIFVSKGLTYYLSAGDSASAGIILTYRT